MIHTAAVAGVWGPWQHFYQINKLATDHVIRACQAAGVDQLVFSSSPSVTFDGSDQSGIDESAPLSRALDVPLPPHQSVGRTGGPR